jgi:hypothetical protein
MELGAISFKFWGVPNALYQKTALMQQHIPKAQNQQYYAKSENPEPMQ